MFAGAFLTSLIYSTKPAGDAPEVTLARQGETSLVIDTSGRAQPLIEQRAATDLESATAALSAGLPLPTGSAAGAVGTKRTPPPAPAASSLASGAGFASPPVFPSDMDSLRKQGFVVPVPGVTPDKLVDSFDDARGGTRRHNALDIMATRRTPVVAAVGGRILKLHSSVSGGLTIYVSDPSSRFVLMYSHLEGFAVGLKENSPVRRGEVIGYVGSSGNANPLAPHLHFAITRNDDVKRWWSGTPLNPFLVYRGKQARATRPGS